MTLAAPAPRPPGTARTLLMQLAALPHGHADDDNNNNNTPLAARPDTSLPVGIGEASSIELSLRPGEEMPPVTNIGYPQAERPQN